MTTANKKATTPRPPRPKVPYEVWVTFTVFVKKQGEKHPWYKHGRGDSLTVEGINHDQALYLGERGIAKLMAERFKIGGE